MSIIGAKLNHKQRNVIHKYEALWNILIYVCFNKESTYYWYL